MWEAKNSRKLFLSCLDLESVPVYVTEAPLVTAITEMNLLQVRPSPTPVWRFMWTFWGSSFDLMTEKLKLSIMPFGFPM